MAGSADAGGSSVNEKAFSEQFDISPERSSGDRRQPQGVRRMTLQFLDALWPNPEGILAAFTLPSARTICAQTASELAEAVVPFVETENIYIRATSLRVAPAPGKRADAAASYAMPGLWADIDIRGPAHKSDELPPDLDAALAIANCTEMAPSLIVHSGNGIQAWWVFREPVVFEDDGHIQVAADLIQRWQGILSTHAKKSGYRIDATHDLARVMRLPGTANRKDPSNPKPVTFTDSGRRYDPSDFAEIVKSVSLQSKLPAVKRDYPLVSIAPIMDGCAWMRRCRDHANTLPEPEWYQMLTVLARCRDSEELAHRLSSPYPSYSHQETQNKLAHAITNSKGPVTCGYVESTLGFSGCSTCANRGRVRSPISIATAPPDQWEGVETVDVATLEYQEVQPDWKELLKRNKKGPLPNMYNAAVALTFHEMFQRSLAFNTLTNVIEITRPMRNIEMEVPAEWADKHDVAFAIWLQRQDIEASAETASRAAGYVARRNPVHPIRDYLQSLRWDGVPRIHDWLQQCLGVEDSAYVRSVGAKWLISAVARVMRPGCKADHMLILEGHQGIGKSTALEVLAGRYFTDAVGNMSDKDAALAVQRVWIVEIGELSSFKKTSEVEHIKGFITRTTDRIRPPYGRYVQEMPRQCVFAGTTNQDQYLTDETGNRRFWPVMCRFANIERLREIRDQLWAEALTAFEDGKVWWLEEAEAVQSAAVQQRQRVETDVWESIIREYVRSLYLGGTSHFNVEDILAGCLKIPSNQWEHKHKIRVGRILAALGVQKQRMRINGEIQRVYAFGEPVTV